MPAIARATTVEEFLGGTADFRTDLYATGGTLLSHAESIELFDGLGAKFTPELKAVTDGFGDSGLTQETYARKMIQEYIDAGIDPRRVFAQSFNLDDVLQWIAEFPKFGKQAVFLDGRNPSDLSANPPPLSEFQDLKSAGVNIVAPPMPALLQTDASNDIVPSGYAVNARKAGLDIISWTTERSGRIVEDVLDGGRHLLLPDDPGRPRERRRHPADHRRAGPGSGDHRPVLGLAGHHDLLRELPQSEIDSIPSGAC